MKVIETKYKGYLFRSRLEARWAVFFDACGVKWEYEPEGFDLGEGIYYLPDFLLHDVLIRNSQLCDLWIEVKGKMTDEDTKKIIKFAESGRHNNLVEITESPIMVVTNIPAGDDILSLEENMMVLAYSNSISPNPFNFELIDGDCFGAFPGINKQGHFTLVGHDGNYTADADDEATEKAYKLARQARFEHR